MLSTLQTSTVREFFNPHLIDEEAEVQVDNLAKLTPSTVGKKRGRSILTPKPSLFLPQTTCARLCFRGKGPCLQLMAVDRLRGHARGGSSADQRPPATHGRRAASRRKSHRVHGSELRDAVKQLELQGRSCWVRRLGTCDRALGSQRCRS